MTEVLVKATVYLFMIVLGYGLKRIGIFRLSDQQVVSKVVMNLTLPAAVITSFGSIKMEPALISVALLGLACNLAMLPLGAIISRRKSVQDRVLVMQNMPGYNIGTFTMPFVQGFLGSFGVAVTSLFDAGSAIMVTGGTYVVVSRVLKTDGGVSLGSVIKRLGSSLPFVTYLGMLVLSLLRIGIPAPVLLFTTPIGAANAFLAMLMIGLMLEFNTDAAMIRQAVSILSHRFLGAVVFALLFYFCLPFPLVVRQVLVLVVFSPIPSLAPIFTARNNGDGALSSLLMSLSVVISLVMMTILILVLGIPM